MNLGKLTAQQIEEELSRLSPAMRDWYMAKIQAVNDWNPSESPEPNYPAMPIEEPKVKRKRKPKPLSDGSIKELYFICNRSDIFHFMEFARAVEKAHGIGK